MKRTLPAFLGLILAAAGLTTVSPARADEPEPVHRYADDRPPERHVRGKLFLTGAAVTAGFYAPVLGASYIWDRNPGAEGMRYPVAGPWLGLSKTRLCNARPELDRCSNFLVVTGAVFLVLDGIGQAGGVGLMLESLFLPAGPKRAVRGESSTAYSAPYLATPDLATPRTPITFSRGDFTVTPVPTVGGNSDVGFSFIGSF